MRMRVFHFCNITPHQIDLMSLHGILGNELVSDDAWNFAEYKAKYVAVEETLEKSIKNI